MDNKEKLVNDSVVETPTDEQIKKVDIEDAKVSAKIETVNEENQNAHIVNEIKDASSNEQVKEENVTLVAEPLIAPTTNEVAKPMETKPTEQKVQKTKVLREKRPTRDKFALFLIIFGFIVMAIGFVPLFSALFLALYYVILVFLVIITLLTLLLNENFRSWLGAGQKVAEIIGAALPYCTYIFGGAIGLFVTSLILYCFSKKKARRIAGIVLNILFTLISVAGLIFVIYIH